MILSALRIMILLLSFCVFGCNQPQPVKIGFVGTLTGRGADYGMSGRNGVLLAVEEMNNNGGLNGKPVELLVRDDAQDTQAAIRAIEELAAEKVDAVIGGMTSGMTLAMWPVANRLQVVLVSPTATADELVGHDDWLFRLSSPTSVHAKRDADFHFEKKGRRRIAVAYEKTSNRLYTEGYLKDFSTVFTTRGGVITRTIAFDAGVDTDLNMIIKKLLESKPDALLFIANSVDTIQLVQIARRYSKEIPLIGSGWAGTEDFLELGGRSIEGVYVSQYFNRDDKTPAYISFAKAYEKRFREPPGFGAAAAYDSARTVLDAMSRKPRGMKLREALLTLGPFPGTQCPIVFDRFGDANRPSAVTAVRNQQFIVEAVVQ